MNRTRHALALLVTLPLVLAAAAPAHAGRPVENHQYSGTDSFAEELCGLQVQIDVTFRGHYMVLPVKGTDQAFLAHDAYHATEIISTDSGWIRTERHGEFHEQTATHVSGDIWEFAFKDAGQFTVYDSSGDRLLRASGVFKAAEQFDTFGDGRPGAEPVPGTFRVLHGAGPSFTDEQFCDVVQDELG